VVRAWVSKEVGAGSILASLVFLLFCYLAASPFLPLFFCSLRSALRAGAPLSPSSSGPRRYLVGRRLGGARGGGSSLGGGQAVGSKWRLVRWDGRVPEVVPIAAGTVSECVSS
jgi:hypothetical protein